MPGFLTRSQSAPLLPHDALAMGSERDDADTLRRHGANSLPSSPDLPRRTNAPRIANGSGTPSTISSASKIPQSFDGLSEATHRTLINEPRPYFPEFDVDQRIDGLIAHTLTRDPSTGELHADVRERMTVNAEILCQRGIDTPDKLDAFLATCWRHDAAMAFVGLGLAKGGGYATGVALAHEKLASLLPDSIRGHVPRLGLVVGLGIGALDVVFNVLGSTLLKPRLYNDADDGDRHLPTSVRAQLPGFSGEAMRLGSTAALFNAVKNSVRVAVPFAQSAIEGRADRSVDRLWADRIDNSVFDGGGGLLSNGARQVYELTRIVSYNTRLLLRDDIASVIDKTHKTWGQTLRDIPSGIERGVDHLMTSPVPIAAVATMGVFISELMTANAGIGLNSTLAGTPADQASPGMLASQRASATFLLAMMTGTIELGAPFVARAGSLAMAHVAQGARQARASVSNGLKHQWQRMRPSNERARADMLPTAHANNGLDQWLKDRAARAEAQESMASSSTSPPTQRDHLTEWWIQVNAA